MLKSLDDFNASQQARWTKLNTPAPNGIACPQCGAECQEIANPSAMIRPASKQEPPQWSIQCSLCSWTGSRVAC